ncbi:MAG: tRNA 2-thiouridine(34) synthase MnmA [Anaerovoracaceae bacterium]|jgi:tRNA-specific 2-thiouridylase
MKSRAVIAMSGGVDSSVAAYLMKQEGFDCVGVTLRLHGGGERDIEDAAAVCARLGIPHRVLDLRDEFEKLVIGKFVREYEGGRTPNPCIDCNREIKFGKLFEAARQLGAEKVATGHYVLLERRPEDGRYLLRRASDRAKDQTYVLYSLTQEQLAMAAFPLSGLAKEDVRAVAEREGFINARKPESQDICFVDGGYADFIGAYTGREPEPGDFVDESGRVLGRHRGIVRYTIGQRRGLGLALKKPMYVVRKDAARNEVVLGYEENLYTDTLRAGDVNWIAFGRLPDGGIRCSAATRYRKPEQPCTVTPGTDPDSIDVKFDVPQRAVTAGQAVVFYDGGLLLGGGTIL